MLTFWVLGPSTHHHQGLLKAGHGASWEGKGCEESLGHCRMCSELQRSEQSAILNMVYRTLYTPLLYFRN